MTKGVIVGQNKKHMDKRPIPMARVNTKKRAIPLETITKLSNFLFVRNDAMFRALMAINGKPQP